jgi:hypothetical protein
MSIGVASILQADIIIAIIHLLLLWDVAQRVNC